MNDHRLDLLHQLIDAQGTLLTRLAAPEPDGSAMEAALAAIDDLKARLLVATGDGGDRPALIAAAEEARRLGAALAEAARDEQDRLRGLLAEEDRRAAALRRYGTAGRDGARYVDLTG